MLNPVNLTPRLPNFPSAWTLPPPGALDLTTRRAYQSMTPIDKVRMLSTSQVLDATTLDSVMAVCQGFSRLPVYRGSNKRDIVGWVAFSGARFIETQQ